MFRLLSIIFILFQLPQKLFSFETQINTVSIDPNFYKGIWYQIYGDNFELTTFEKNAYCVYANYTILNEKTLGVLNWERKYSVNGPIQNITGYAVVTENPGQLVVYLSGNFPAPYWVIQVGPIINNEYEYAIVSDPYTIGLYVLARDVEQFFELYDKEVIDFLYENNFTSLYNKPIKITQSGCTYS